VIGAAAMLAATALSVALRESALAAAVGALVLGARILGARGRWTPSGGFGVANAITLARLAFIAALPSLFAIQPRLAFVGLLVGLFVLDGIDGAVARARGEASDFGAALDMETDALGVLLLTLLLWEHRLAPAWVLVAGLWRYVYAAIVAAVPSLGEAPRSRVGRAAFFVLMCCLIGSFIPGPWPWPWPSSPAHALAAVGTIAVSLSFLHSLARSRALTPN
jgi:phosphatidylglycerophosphate synthase